MKTMTATIVLTLAVAAGGAWADTVDNLLQTYATQGAGPANAAAAKAMWTREFKPADADKPRSCSTCHTQNLQQSGKHATTGKAIEPLAPSANDKRLTDAKHVEKWFGRNCKWTLGRECSVQEKSDFLAFIRGS